VRDCVCVCVWNLYLPESVVVHLVEYT